VEPTGANIVRQSLDAGRPLAATKIDTVADGLAAPFAAELSQAIISHYVDDVILVSDEEIIAAMKLILSRRRCWWNLPVRQRWPVSCRDERGAQPGATRWSFSVAAISTRHGSRP
jgi:hypothetical protein